MKVAFDKGAPLDSPRMTAGHVIESDGDESLIVQSFANMAADIAGSACNENMPIHMNYLVGSFRVNQGKGCLEDEPAV